MQKMLMLFIWPIHQRHKKWLINFYLPLKWNNKVEININLMLIVQLHNSQNKIVFKIRNNIFFVVDFEVKMNKNLCKCWRCNLSFAIISRLSRRTTSCKTEKCKRNSLINLFKTRTRKWENPVLDSCKEMKSKFTKVKLLSCIKRDDFCR